MATATISPPSINVSPPSNCSQSSSGSTCTVVPQYPYNVSMPSFAGALLPYERSPMPDDNDVQTRLPSRCVDYLSHNWDESDVWTSWKAMTRHKNEMANGVRLENASWRTWAKQRNNLKTISPETLNWLKDSDVTWLYGPLHTAVDPVPPPKLSSIQDRFNLDGQSQLAPSQPASSANSRPGSSASVRSTKTPGKSILKHRSLSEILGVGLSRGPESASEEGSEDGKGRREQPKRARVLIGHPASDPALIKLCNGSAGSDSNPVVTNGYESSDLANSGEDSDAARRESSKPSQNTGSGPNGDDVKPKKHISFSHRVEQCIAVDSEDERSVYTAKVPLRPPSRSNGSIRAPPFEDDEDDDDDEDDLLTFRSSAPRQPGLHAVSHRYTSPSTAGTMIEPYSQATGSSALLAGPSAGEPFTIARMAPTTLKSSEVLPAPSPVVVYDKDPPRDSINTQPSYARPTYTVTATPSGSSAIDYSSLVSSSEGNSQVTPVFSHQPSCSYSTTYGPVAVSEVFSPPAASPSSDILSSAPVQFGSSSSLNHWNVVTPDDEDTEEFTAMGFDYFCGPDLGLGDEYNTSKLPSQNVASIQAGFNSSELNGKSSNREDSTLIRSVRKDHALDTASPSPARTPGKLVVQEPILVPQIKSNKSSSSSSLSSSPFSSRNDSSSSLTLPSNDGVIHHASIPSADSTINCQGDRDRLSRGRSFSRGSSCSSFERTSTDKRPSSSSPTQSPPIVVSSSNATSSRPGSRPGGSFRANSYDSVRSINKSSLINAPIGEETEEEAGAAASLTNSTTVRGSHKKNASASIIDSASLSNSPKSCIPSASTPEATTRSPKSVNPTSLLRRPCLISDPKPTSAQLDGSNVVLQPTDLDNSSTGSHSREAGNTDAPSADVSSTLPTLFSLLSRQGNTSNPPWWSDERTNRLHVVADGTAPRPSLRSHNSDSSASTFIGRASYSQNDRKYLGANRGSDSVDELRSSPEDEFGFGNYYGERSPEDEDTNRDETENGGVISRAADIVETAKVLVGALWSVGTRSIWGGTGPENSQVDKNETSDSNSRVYSRRASTGGLPSRSEDEPVTYQHPVVLRPQCSTDAIS